MRCPSPSSQWCWGGKAGRVTYFIWQTSVTSVCQDTRLPHTFPALFTPLLFTRISRYHNLHHDTEFPIYVLPQRVFLAVCKRTTAISSLARRSTPERYRYPFLFVRLSLFELLCFAQQDRHEKDILIQTWITHKCTHRTCPWHSSTHNHITQL
jgi:hypothetical protein